MTIPSEEALSKARARLGPEPLRLLFEAVASPLATAQTPGGFWRGLRLMSIDGTTLDVQDTQANWARFGGPTTKDAAGTAMRGGFAQVRLVALAECGTRALIAATIGPFTRGEKTLTADLLPRLDASMLVLADRNFPGYELWRDASATGAALVWRVGANFSLPVDAVLTDGSYLSRFKAPRELARDGAKDLAVRIVEYHVLEQDGTVAEIFALATTLVDPVAAPARDLAELYHQRWQIETAFGALKSQLRGDNVVLRSKTPDGAEQECWALLCAYHAVRDILLAAATLTERDPLRLSFVHALDAVRGPVADSAAFPPSPTAT